MAVILLGAYYAVDRDQARREPEKARQAEVERIDTSRPSLQDMRKKMRAASRLTAEEGCARLREDFDAWDDYLDKKTRRKLKGLIAKCGGEGEETVSAEP